MRRLIVLVALAVLLGCVGATRAAADELPPPVFPPGLSGPADVGNDAATDPSGPSIPSGPTYVVTPGSKGTALPAPSTDPARDAEKAGVPQQVPGPTGERAKNMVAAPAAAASGTGPDGTAPDARVWLAASGALLMLILSEFTRLNRRFRLRRPSA
jgi:hypothetical protein